MSVLQKSLHPDEKVKAGKIGGTLTKAGLGVAVVFLGLSVILTVASSADAAKAAGHASKWSRFLHAYVIGWSYIFTICLGMLWIIMLHHLVRGRWVTAVRRICE